MIEISRALSLGFLLQCFVCPVLVAQVEPDQPDEPDEPATSFAFEVDPLVNLVFIVRHYAEQPPDAAVPAELSDAVNAARAVDDALGFTLFWNMVLADLPQAGSAAAWQADLADLPETFTLRDGRTLDLRAIMTPFVTTLIDAEAAYLEHTWPADQARLNDEAVRLRTIFSEADPAWTRELQRLLDFKTLRGTVPVYLTTRGPWPGGVTYRFETEGVCFISLDEIEPSHLVEIIIHESMHAHDIADADRSSALWQFRIRLHDLGLTVRDREALDAPHLLMFMTAAELTRRFFSADHQHEDYGDRFGVYGRLDPVSTAVRDHWSAWTSGTTTLEAAIDAMAHATKATRAPRAEP